MARGVGQQSFGAKGGFGLQVQPPAKWAKRGFGVADLKHGVFPGGGQILNFLHYAYFLLQQKPYDLIINLILVKICISGTIYILCVMKNGEIRIFCILYFCNFTDLFLRGVNG